MSIASKLEYLDNTKNYIRQCIQQKGVAVPANTTFRQYGDKILEIETEKHPDGWEGEGGGSNKLTTGTALATGKTFVLSPPQGYDGFSSVNVSGDANLKPENIAQGITIYGVTGTKTVPSEVTSTIPPAYQSMFEQARQQWNGEYEHLMILESNEAVAFGFMLTGFGIDSYDTSNSEFTAHRWVYVAYNKITQIWKVEDHTNEVSNGNSYIWNIRYCDTQIYYGAGLLYPFSGNGPEDSLTYTDSFTFIMRVGYFFRFSGDALYGTAGSNTGTDNAIGVIIDFLSCRNFLMSYTFIDEPEKTGYTTSAYVYSSRVNGGNYLSRIVWTFNSTDNGKLVRITMRGCFGFIYKFLRLVSFETPLPYTLNNISYAQSGSEQSSTNSSGHVGCGMFDTSDIETVPSDLFSKINPDISHVNQLFARSKIKSLPSGLLHRFKHLQRADGMFTYALELSSLPEDLFYGLTELYSVRSMCYNTNSLTSIPSNLFSTNVNLEDCSYAFASSQINSIPSGLLVNAKNLKTCSHMFDTCLNLRRLEDSFLPDSQNTIDLSYMFYKCTGLTNIPESIFSKASDISYMFYDCSGITGNIPELWNDDRFTDIPHKSCFYGCSNAKNYNDVPYGWR